MQRGGEVGVGEGRVGHEPAPVAARSRKMVPVYGGHPAQDRVGAVEANEVDMPPTRALEVRLQLQFRV